MTEYRLFANEAFGFNFYNFFKFYKNPVEKIC